MLEISVSDKGKETIVFLKGPIDENAGQVLADLHSRVLKTVVFNFKEVAYINSLGIRSWVNFLRHIQEGREIFFEECTSDVVMQMNMMAMFRGDAVVRSFYGDYTCDNCGHEQAIRFEVTEDSDLQKDLVEQPCEKCSTILSLDEDDENYLIFLE
ncbi:hypothetical protein [Pseudobacteriovorax antillogorgiicola]|uniref:STAS domain-containing protein n=1 Tax=Pseudobacteriovorax antillogorgiicola TaxID=1513793 RepID=A0A1Y6BP13_9BACT|nr:hypothetical protein [Pseudobacteriovorax antillogorgiicola]TCS53951.1 hypothetical protein EDD56_107264 [Pseudobacteriovorax antillogorgiicola]SMF20109.1 hypothetical protein SAMN06296036_1078 [Pseudobacteriovorax antillogorgiicola]